MKTSNRMDRDRSTSSQIDGKLPPQAKEIEQIILGACLIESDAFEKIASELSESDFYDKRNQSVFKAISGLYKERKPIDMMTVTQAMLSSGELESIGGPIYIASLTSKIGSSAHILDHAMIVKERSIQRRGLAIANDLENAIYSNEDIGDVLHKAINGSETLMEELIGKSNGEHISKALKGSMNGLYKRVEMARKNIRSGVDTGLHDLNKITNGWQPGNLVIIAARPSMGKALRMDAKVLTPSGWKLNKDLAIGDQVCSVDGAESRVTGIFPQGHVKTYMVEFSDGRKIECCGSHLWSVISSKFNAKAERVVSTLELMDLISKERYSGRISIPLFSGIFGEKKDFVIHPYLMGVLLGDGVLSKGVSWCKPDKFIADKIQGMVDYDVIVSDDRFLVTNKENRKVNKYLSELKSLGLLNVHSYEKFIPDMYIDACRDQRVELLNGLLDTDGDIDKNGAICYNTTSAKLARGVQTLCWSLGYKCSLRERRSFLYGERKRNSFRLVIVADNPRECFTLPRKFNRVRPDRRNKPLTVMSVTPTNRRVECQCISVSHEKALYITDDYIVTHNTAVMLHLAKSAARSNIPVAIFSLEMSDISLANRLILSECDVDPERFKSGYMTNEEINKVETAVNELWRLPIYVDDNPCVTMDYIRSRCKILKKQGKCGIIMADYLQLAESGEREGSREREVAKMSRTAKITAKELKVPFLLLSQLNRGNEARPDKKPLLSDLRESGAIEQDADIVMFIHRPEYYKIEVKDKNGNVERNYGELIVAKNRDGATGLVKFKHNDGMTKFYDYGSCDKDMPF